MKGIIEMSAKTTQVGGSHYKGLKIQPVEYIHGNELGFCEGSVVKYVTRWRDKGGIDDLRKARHFIELLIEMETATHADMTPNVWDESRMDTIGRNGNDGEHYAATEQLRQIDEALDAMHFDERTQVHRMNCGGASFEESADFDPVPATDMTDPRNWRAGDWVECVSDDETFYTKGMLYPVVAVDNSSIAEIEIGHNTGSNAKKIWYGYGMAGKAFRFHARPDADGWIKWEGGECPVMEGQMVSVKYRNGDEATGPALDPSCDLEQGFWDDDDNPLDIVAYRPIAPSADKG